MREGKTVEIFGEEGCYLHCEGAQGGNLSSSHTKLRLLVRAREALQQVEVDARKTHWLNTIVCHRRRQGRRQEMHAS